MTEFLDLVDDCLSQVLSYCDINTLVAVSQTCNHLKWIAETFSFPKFTYYFCRAGKKADYRVIKRIGAHIEKLHVCFTRESTPANMVEYCQFLAANIGVKIRELKIVNDIDVIPPLQLLATVLQQLHVLDLTSQSGEKCSETYNVDLAALCPDLREMIFSGANKFPPKCSSFRRLETLKVRTVYKYDREIDKFLAMNPQITKFVCRPWECVNFVERYIDFDKITHNLVNLEELYIAVPLTQNFSPHLLARLQKLRSIKLDHIGTNFSDVLVNLAKIKDLTTIFVKPSESYDNTSETVYEQQQQALIRIAIELENLEDFYVSLPSSIEVFWERETAIDFVRFAKKLELVVFQKLHLECSPEEFIRDLAKARKSANPVAVPLSTYMDCPVSRYVFEVTNNEDNQFDYNKRTLVFYTFEIGARRETVSKNLSSDNMKKWTGHRINLFWSDFDVKMDRTFTTVTLLQKWMGQSVLRPYEYFDLIS